MDGILEEDRIRQCFKGVSQRPKKGRVFQAEGSACAKAWKTESVQCAYNTRRCLVKIEGKGG